MMSTHQYDAKMHTETRTNEKCTVDCSSPKECVQAFEFVRPNVVIYQVALGHRAWLS